MAEVGKCGVLGHKTPAHPYCVRACLRQREFEPSIVDVTALGLLCVWVDNLSGTETHSLVGLTHKHAMAIRLGEKRNRAQRCAIFLIEIADSVNETHGSFAAIHDSYALKFVFHNPSINRSSGQSVSCSSCG